MMTHKIKPQITPLNLADCCDRICSSSYDRSKHAIADNALSSAIPRNHQNRQQDEGLSHRSGSEKPSKREGAELYTHAPCYDAQGVGASLYCVVRVRSGTGSEDPNLL